MTTQNERLEWLISCLLDEMPEYRELCEPMRGASFGLFRSLVNVRPPIPAKPEFLAVQDELLNEELVRRGVVDSSALEPIQSGIYLWQGDITSLRCDAIVNAVNSRMLGCFRPGHGCIDNAIHTYAGVQLRLACAELMKKRGGEEPPGMAEITPAFNLPCKHVLHTVGPIVMGRATQRDETLLASCYRSCLGFAESSGADSVAFCCVSTGEFRFPNRRAAEIAVRTVKKYRADTGGGMKVIFNVFKDKDREIYRGLLGADK